MSSDLLQPVRDIVSGLRFENLSAETLIDVVRERFDLSTLSSPDIERLRREACEMVWRAPRIGWAYARVACEAADKDDQLSAKCKMTLGITLNALGKFFEAPPLLEWAAEVFERQGQWKRWIRCQCELAISYIYRSEFDKAKAALASAYTRLPEFSDPHTNAHYHRADGLLHYEQNRAKEAVESFRKAADLFLAAEEPGEAAVTWCYLAGAQRSLDPRDTLTWIEKARSLISGDRTVHEARCDYYLALTHEELNKHLISLDLYLRARAIFAEKGIDYLTAMCDLQRGINYYLLDDYAAALQAYRSAHDNFESQGLHSHVARCDINMALVYYSMNHYIDAQTIYQRVADAALAEGRTLRVARCFANMALCYSSLGRYDRALALHHQALQAFVEAGNWSHVAGCQENLAAVYRQLGHYNTAIQHCLRARETFIRLEMDTFAARCNSNLAQIYQALDNYESALAYLREAQKTYETQGNDVQVAVCFRHAALVYSQLGQSNQAFDSLTRATSIFVEHGLLADAALCELIEGEVRLAIGDNDISKIIKTFEMALAVLRAGFPDEAWRAEYGLGRCVLLEEPNSTLAHWTTAMEYTNQTRWTLPTERLSGGFFANRRRLYEDTLALALRLEQNEQALVVTEAAKAQTFATWNQDDGWRTNLQYEPHLQQLFEQEARLRNRIARMRNDLRWVDINEPTPIMRIVKDTSGQIATLEELTRLSKQYEGLLEQLRTVAHSKFDMQPPRLFTLQAMREKLNESLGSHWGCVAYYLLQDRLVTFYVDPHHLNVQEKALTKFDRQALEQCTNPILKFRDEIYEGSRHRTNATTSPGPHLLRHLYNLLMPPEVGELGTNDVLIISPHAELHRLSFQALMNECGPLINQMPVVITPSLSALSSLLARSESHGDDMRALAIGLSQFGKRAPTLPYAEKEIEALKEVFNSRMQVLWQTQATRTTLNQMNDSKELLKFDVVHFTTHALQNYMTPSQSYIMLYDDDLSYADVINLRLNARLVVLGSCNGVLGTRYSGDEVMGLAQAFFFAGAQTVIATLWPVEDESTSEFMTRFYSHLRHGKNAARACWLAQLEMVAAGFTPYQWAPFTVIGLP